MTFEHQQYQHQTLYDISIYVCLWLYTGIMWRYLWMYTKFFMYLTIRFFVLTKDKCLEKFGSMCYILIYGMVNLNNIACFSITLIYLANILANYSIRRHKIIKKCIRHFILIVLLEIFRKSCFASFYGIDQCNAIMLFILLEVW